MIRCPVCGTNNHHLAVVCTSCGGFLQTRVENLDLFQTAWNILERPARTFHLIAIARHKNYMLVLAAIAGIALTFLTFWIIKAGDHTTSLVNLLAAGLAVGPPAGIVVNGLIALSLFAAARAGGTSIRFRNAYAMTSYALVPVVISVVILLPLELMSFGIYFFTANPSPYVLKPVSYLLLLGLDGTFGIWSLVLYLVGIQRLSNLRWPRVVALGAASLAVPSLLLAGTLHLLLPSVQ